MKEKKTIIYQRNKMIINLKLQQLEIVMQEKQLFFGNIQKAIFLMMFLIQKQMDICNYGRFQNKKFHNRWRIDQITYMGYCWIGKIQIINKQLFQRYTWNIFCF
ncbi:hypothetical protein IMG5_047700 [Ichthyophthirius multifiliis]|uniref:Uncharacterized protein n=1 Tax=Ichthyophthirius multifiliis TaxID=5932 RepID=G0QMD0_ICHMU|nr:hypothetical protein IMG5_047700 [Ichthyophthirius multifiliis]EGR33624.1 hypothetical protein IMG5_047700 [Ichthyophthirius multifiliis]|eukprot:XP_004037610.1 hypothetical protein IMG5_047700 [Ichthyophthirius multifiliis]